MAMNDLPARLVSALEGRYTLERQLGEGGMATVYLAQDVRHERKVALKVLRPELAAVVGGDRFLAEIRTTASLQHPHILPLFDSGQADGLVFYVMPYVQGESLRDRLDRERQLPIDEAVRIASGVAGALEHAHKQGVIHRDIKPANILLQDGEPIVADFGIALAVSHAGGGRITETGLSLGTPHYMSPEQATGEKTLDVRTDVYALGCVLYEMLAGEPPYSGSTAQSVLARILTEEPRRVTEVRRSVPPNIEATVATAIEKLPADRFESADAFARALKDRGYERAPRAPEAHTGFRARETLSIHSGGHASLPWSALRSDRRFLGVATVAALAITGLTVGQLRQREAALNVPTTRVTFQLPDTLTGGVGASVAISPDGKWFAWVGADQGPRQIYLRRSDAGDWHAVPGSEGAYEPFFSPDGQWMGFLRGPVDARQLMKVPLTGGPPVVIARTINAGGPRWGPDGRIAFHGGGSLYIVPDVGGEPTLILSEEGRTLFWPELLPDGKAVLFTSRVSLEDSEIKVLELATGEVSTLAQGTHPHYVPTGHLVYGHASQVLFAVPFDLRRREVTGPPIPLVEPVTVHNGGATQFAVSDNGTALYADQSLGDLTLATQLVLISSAGGEQPVSLPVGHYGIPRFSPDGRRLAFHRGTTAPTVGRQIFVHDLRLGATVQLTHEGENTDAIWSRDGTWLSYGSTRRGTLSSDVFQRRADGTGEEEQLFRLEYSQWPRAWADDGRLVFSENPPGRRQDIAIADIRNDSAVVVPYLRADWNESEPALSPDSKWLAYVSNETASGVVYVRGFPDQGEKVSVSEQGGRWPKWSANGTTVYYWAADTLMAASIRQEPFAVIGREQVLIFPIAAGGANNWDVHPDGRFVIIKRSEDAPTPGTAAQGIQSLTLIVNWFAELEARMQSAGAGRGGGGG